jgi:hypothetical protein
MGYKAVSQATFDSFDNRNMGVLREEPFQSETQTILKRIVCTDHKTDPHTGEKVVSKVTKLTLFNMEVLDGHDHEEHWRTKGICEEKPALMEGEHVK